MTKYNEMKLEIFNRDIEKNKIYISRDKRSIPHYQENIDNLEIAIQEIINNEDTSISYEVKKEEKEKSKIQDRYIVDNDFYFGSDGYESIDEDVMKNSIRYNISVEDSLNLILLGLKIMSLNARIGMNPHFLEALKKTDKDLSKYPSTEKLQKDKEGFIEEILRIIKKEKYIPFEDFSKMYIKILEERKGESKKFDKFLDWLNQSKEYGVGASFCEEESEGYSYLYEPFIREKITIELVENGD